MNLTPEITYRNIRPSPFLDEVIRRHAAALERFHGHILSCHVSVEAPHRGRRHGAPFRVRVELVVPGGEIVVGRCPEERATHTDLYFAVREAFRACRRQLQDFVRMRRGEVKSHPQFPRREHVAPHS